MQSFLIVFISFWTWCIRASETSFSVSDDVFAFPQFEVVFSESYITYDEAMRIAQHQRTNRNPHSFDSPSGQVSLHDGPPVAEEDALDEYEIVKLQGRPHLCAIPFIKSVPTNQTEEKPSEDEQRKELARATDKGRELLQGMEGNQCLFYSTGWWTYSFCYNSQVRQFHALSPGAGGGRVFPPQEDPATPSYILGRFDHPPAKGAESDANLHSTELAELETKAETSYLVQKLDGGTPCDLTGNDRKIEIQFHCNPQLTDRIGWIKETATCAYLMIVYTPRLCNDVAFLPPKQTRAHTISCREMLTVDQISTWEVRKKQEAARKMIDQGSSPKVILGNVEVGAMKHVGKEGKKIERGRVVLTQEEKAETIIMQKDGQISSVSKSELKKLKLNPEDVEAFKQELQELAGTKDWKIERLDDATGKIQLRGVVSTDDEEDESSLQPDDSVTDKEKGSEEEYKEDL